METLQLFFYYKSYILKKRYVHHLQVVSRIFYSRNIREEKEYVKSVSELVCGCDKLENFPNKKSQRHFKSIGVSYYAIRKR